MGIEIVRVDENAPRGSFFIGYRDGSGNYRALKIDGQTFHSHRHVAEDIRERYLENQDLDIHHSVQIYRV